VTGETAVSAIRLSDELRAKIDAWAKQQAEPMSRSEAIRILVERGLKRR
jgi:metal-responsive CopG/Arc/MetJ family transcriptional regulator